MSNKHNIANPPEPPLPMPVEITPIPPPPARYQRPPEIPRLPIPTASHEPYSKLSPPTPLDTNTSNHYFGMFLKRDPVTAQEYRNYLRDDQDKFVHVYCPIRHSVNLRGPAELLKIKEPVPASTFRKRIQKQKRILPCPKELLELRRSVPIQQRFPAVLVTGNPQIPTGPAIPTIIPTIPTIPTIPAHAVLPSFTTSQASRVPVLPPQPSAAKRRKLMTEHGQSIQEVVTEQENDKIDQATQTSGDFPDAQDLPAITGPISRSTHEEGHNRSGLPVVMRTAFAGPASVFPVQSEFDDGGPKIAGFTDPLAALPAPPIGVSGSAIREIAAGSSSAGSGAGPSSFTGSTAVRSAVVGTGGGTSALTGSAVVDSGIVRPGPARSRAASSSVAGSGAGPSSYTGSADVGSGLAVSSRVNMGSRIKAVENGDNSYQGMTDQADRADDSE